MTTRGRQDEQGVALVVTVIVVAMLAVVGVAFMQSTSTDRDASRSMANLMRAELAAEAGVAAAGSILARETTNDHFIIVANNDNQLFVGNGSGQPAGRFAYLPVFSTTASLTNAVMPITSSVVPVTNVADGTNFVFANLPTGLSITSPVITWMYINRTNASGQLEPIARFAFWAEDLAAKLDLSVVGTNTLSPIARRPTGTNPAEIALWSVFRTNVASSRESDEAGDELVEDEARRSILTVATARLASSQVMDDTNVILNFAANLRHDTNEPEVIPFGFGYRDQGKLKFNINTNLSTNGVTFLASVISNNLVNPTNGNITFAARAGAMNSNAYVRGIAASMVDYADADANPTVDDPQNPSYLGIENIPWPNELFDRLQFREVTDDGIIRAELKDWIEVWNMGDKPTKATTITIDNNYDMALVFSNTNVSPPISFQSNLKAADFEAGSLGSREFAVPALQPNEYKVVASSSTPDVRRLAWQSSLQSSEPRVKDGWRIFSPTNLETKNMSFKVYVAGVLVQQTKGGRWPRHLAPTDGLRRMPQTPNRFIFCNPIGFASQTRPMSQSGVPAHSGGDPRAQLFLSDPLRAANYKGYYATPGSRNLEYTNLVMRRPPFPESEMNPAKYWPDTGHAGPTNANAVPVDYSQDPDSFSAATNTNNFVMYRNDTGAFTNILELGNIYDPMQWGDPSGSNVTNQPGLWTNLTSSAAPDARFGGRNTLRIGRWEFSRFTNDGTRASQLLDVFSAGTTNNYFTFRDTSGRLLTNTNVVVGRVAGRINLNTASTSVLRALAAGVANSTDSVLAPGGTNFYLPVTAVSNFVKGVTNRRTQRPFFSTAELSMISHDTNLAWPASAVFGNSNIANVTAWNDKASEEWFSKIYPLSSVRSRNFAVYSVGQALQPGTTNVLSTSRIIRQIFVSPIRNTNTGMTTNCRIETLRSWSL